MTVLTNENEIRNTLRFHGESTLLSDLRKRALDKLMSEMVDALIYNDIQRIVEQVEARIPQLEQRVENLRPAAENVNKEIDTLLARHKEQSDLAAKQNSEQSYHDAKIILHQISRMRSQYAKLLSTYNAAVNDFEKARNWAAQLRHLMDKPEMTIFAECLQIAQPERYCAVCQEPLTGKQSKFCSPACRQHDYRQRKALGEV